MQEAKESLIHTYIYVRLHLHNRIRVSKPCNSLPATGVYARPRRKESWVLGQDTVYMQILYTRISAVNLRILLRITGVRVRLIVDFVRTSHHDFGENVNIGKAMERPVPSLLYSQN